MVFWMVGGEGQSEVKAPRMTRAVRAAVILSALYFVARLTGLVQLSLINSLLPAEAAAAYIAAFTLPDYLNYIVASGTLSLTFIPIFTRFWDRDNEEAAWNFFSTLACVMGALLVVLTLILMLFARPLVSSLVAPGFAVPGKEATLDLTVAMTRIFLPAQVLFYLGGLMIGALNSFKRFAITGWTGALYNVVAVAVAVPLYLITEEPLVFAWGILIGAFIGNFLLPLVALLRGPRAERPHFRPSFDLSTPGVRRYFVLTLPIVFSLSIATADVWVWRYFASFEGEAALRNINAAYRLMIAAQGLLGQAAAVAAFPFLASKVASGAWDEFTEFLRTGLRRLLFLTLGASLVMILAALPLTKLVYGYGEFAAPRQLAQTASCFAFFSVGLWIWAAQAFVARGFYALGDTRTPIWTGTICSVALAAMCVFVRESFGIVGLAGATTIGIALYFVVLLLLLDRKLARGHGVELGLHRVGGTILRTSAALALATPFGLAARTGADLMLPPSRGSDVVSALATIFVTVVVFGLGATVFRIPEWTWLRAKVRRR